MAVIASILAVVMAAFSIQSTTVRFGSSTGQQGDDRDDANFWKRAAQTGLGLTKR